MSPLLRRRRDEDASPPPDREVEEVEARPVEVVAIARAPASAPPVKPGFTGAVERRAQVVERLDFEQRMEGYLNGLDAVYTAEAWREHPKHRRWLTRNYERYLRKFIAMTSVPAGTG